MILNVFRRSLQAATLRCRVSAAMPNALAVMHCTPVRWQASNPQRSGSHAGGSNPNSNSSSRIEVPLCEWNNVHDTDPSKGYVLRATYHNAVVHLSYTPQSKLRSDVLREGGATPDAGNADAVEPTVPASSLVDRNKRVLLVLPSPFVSRMLGVLSGNMPAADIVTRTTTGTFTGDMNAYTFTLACESTLPNGERLAWNVTLSPGEAIMLDRFLRMSLERNFGFTNFVELPSDSKRRAGGK